VQGAKNGPASFGSRIISFYNPNKIKSNVVITQNKDELHSYSLVLGPKSIQTADVPI
jgi:hypothetical protein